MTAPSCAVCGKAADPAYRPFCSRRCADVDLQRWLTNRYAVPAEEPREGLSHDGADED